MASRRAWTQAARPKRRGAGCGCVIRRGLERKNAPGLLAIGAFWIWLRGRATNFIEQPFEGSHITRPLTLCSFRDVGEFEEAQVLATYAAKLGPRLEATPPTLSRGKQATVSTNVAYAVQPKAIAEPESLKVTSPR